MINTAVSLLVIFALKCIRLFSVKIAHIKYLVVKKIRSKYEYSLINGGQKFGHSAGQLNRTLHDIALAHLATLGHQVKKHKLKKAMISTR